MSKFQKFICKGYVAVLYSPGYGIGWSTFNPELAEALMFDRELVLGMLAGCESTPNRVCKLFQGDPIADYTEGRLRVAQIVSQKYPQREFPRLVLEGANRLHIAWVQCGAHFIIKSSSGSESVCIVPSDGYVA